MKHYKNSDYAINKFSEGIVYRFADGIVEVTLVDFLAENPDKTKEDFLALKELSDGIYHEQVKDENAQTKKNVLLDLGVVEKSLQCHEQSPEQMLIYDIEAQEDIELHSERMSTVNLAMDKLTEIQRKRYLMYHIEGLTIRQIADIEGVGHSKIQKSIEGAQKKIKKVLTST